MKCSYFVAFLLVIIAKASLADFEVYTIGERQPGEQLLGFATNSTQDTADPDVHELSLFLSAPEGSYITFVHINIFPSWTMISWPTYLPHDSIIQVYNGLTTHLSANAYYYGFLPGSPEAIAAQIYDKSDVGRTTVTNPNASNARWKN